MSAVLAETLLLIGMSTRSQPQLRSPSPRARPTVVVMYISPPKAADGAPAARPPGGGGPIGLLAAQPARAVRRQVNTAPGECVQRCEDS